MSCCHPSHKLPSFPLLCNHWFSPSSPPAPAVSSFKCQLVWGTNKLEMPLAMYPGQGRFIRFLYLPAFTDIRSTIQGVAGSVVEVPAGSKRYYNVIDVDDTAKGFPNEFRVATISPTTAYGNWLIPMP